MARAKKTSNVPPTTKKGKKVAKPPKPSSAEDERKVISVTARQWNGKKQEWEYWTTYSDLTSSFQPRDSFVDIDDDGSEVLTQCFQTFEEAHPITGVNVSSECES